MLLIVLLFVCYGQLESFHLNSQGGNRFLGTSRAELKRTLLKASQFDENLTDLDQLGRAELQTLAKEYGIKATGKTAEIIEQLSLAISSINAESEGELPSAEQTLKVSPLEKTVTVETSTGKHSVICSCLYWEKTAGCGIIIIVAVEDLMPSVCFAL